MAIEVKTAYRGANSAWQHENLYKTAADISIFIDIDYQGIYISIIPEYLLPLGFNSEIFGRKHGTLRQNKDDGWKLDFSLATLKNFSKYGDTYSKYFTSDEASFENIGNYVAERILKYVGNI